MGRTSTQTDAFACDEPGCANKVETSGGKPRGWDEVSRDEEIEEEQPDQSIVKKWVLVVYYYCPDHSR